jgi:hypothetical protein
MEMWKKKIEDDIIGGGMIFILIELYVTDWLPIVR